MNLVALNLLLNCLVFYLAIRIYLVPKLANLRVETVLVPVLLLHSTRHLGLLFLASGATYPGLPFQFAYPAALGDLATAVLALLSLFALRKKLRIALPFVWIFNVFGTLDLLLAITLATFYNAPPSMGPAYWIPVTWVPALLVTHGVTFYLLWTRSGYVASPS